MTEKEKMLNQNLYNANYDVELISDRMSCKSLCQKYNSLSISNIEERNKI